MKITDVKYHRLRYPVTEKFGNSFAWIYGAVIYSGGDFDRCGYYGMGTGGGVAW